MNENINYERLEERIFKPKRLTFIQFYKKNSFIRLCLKIILIIGLILCIKILYTDSSYSLIEKYLIYFSTSISIFLSLVFLLSVNESENNDSLIDNNEKNEYMVSVGVHVKKFYGNAKKTYFKSNIIKQLLFDAEKFKRHMMILATVGAGKSFLMKGIAEQQILLGGGYFIIDGKGTAEFAKEMYALAALYGREKDFIHLNLLDTTNTHSISPLKKGSVNNLFEILNAMLIGEENQWKAKQREYMKNVLKLLVYKRDHEKIDLNFTILTEYMSLTKLVNEAILYREESQKVEPLKDFIKYVSSSISIDYNEFLNAHIQIDYDSNEDFYPKGKIINTNNSFLEKVYKNTNNTQIQGVYDCTVSIGAWRDIITTLGSDYKNVFNAKEPDISLWEVIQHNKLLFVTLPTMDSDTTPKELGRLMLGLLKGVAQEKAKNAIQPKIPFLCMFDEIGSYIINGFGLLMSKSRALGISIIPIFQSFSQIDIVDEGKGLETKQMLDVTGTLIVMKVTNPDVTELLNKKIKQTKFIDKNYSEKRKISKAEISGEDSFNISNEEAIKHFEVEKMNNGEMMVLTDGEIYKAVANAEINVLEKGKIVTYEGKNLSKKIPLTQYINKDDLFNEIEKNQQFWER